MPPQPRNSLRYISFYAQADDCKLFEHRYGRQWPEQLRRLMREDNKRYREMKRKLEEAVDGK